MAKTHGLCNHRLYDTYRDMINRCHNDDSRKYRNYGSRGISVCREWRSEKRGLTCFIKWAVNQGMWSEELMDLGYTLDREDNDGNYEPSNCRFVNKTEQSLNRRVSAKNKSGYKRIHELKNGAWRVVIKISGYERYNKCHNILEYAVEEHNTHMLKIGREDLIQEWRGDE